ncbi:hypothetical protein WOLCODRAFT_22851 [Wolfiporia cocos MD-104 SS10]|uniref:Cupredoxin n=1 Tax=Wolfiporia cocos (strain MD-104) TaxID=742152 RepID=A0A2H3J6D0_WOLCO|nr:hypothetical protein WOLCODRAFT_22851 [Wolfiporia cocos MD-104 SS10]
MRFSALVAAALVPAGLALGEIINIKVGENRTLSYNPPSVNASVGDTLVFEFVAMNHTVTQSTFAAPCSNFTFANGSTGIDSGFQFVATNATTFPTYSFTVENTSAPLWFYCRQTGHCEKGMVFAVNPTPAKSFADFQKAAEALASTTASGSVSATGSSTATSSSTSSTSTTTTTTSGAGAVHFGGAAMLMSAVGMVAGLVL